MTKRKREGRERERERERERRWRRKTPKYEQKDRKSVKNRRKHILLDIRRDREVKRARERERENIDRILFNHGQTEKWRYMKKERERERERDCNGYKKSMFSPKKSFFCKFKPNQHQGDRRSKLSRQKKKSKTKSKVSNFRYFL